MKKLVCAILFLVLIAAAWLILRREERVGEEGMRERGRLIFNSPLLQWEWARLKCDTELNSSIAQVLHIVDGKEARCAEELRGEQYDKLRKPFLCNKEDAGRIDGAVRRRDDCTFPVERPVDEKTREYYAFVLVCVADMKNWSYVEGGKCPLDYPQSVVYVVVDEKGDVFY